MIATSLAVDVGNYLIYVVAAIPLLIAIVVAFAVWRNARKEGVVRDLQIRLSSTDRDVRRRALDDVDDEILSRNAALFCDLLANEDDPEVLDALAAAVARSKWEPSNDPALVELRRWVAGGEAARTRSSAAAEAAQPPPEQATAPAPEPGPEPPAPEPAPEPAIARVAEPTPVLATAVAATVAASVAATAARDTDEATVDVATDVAAVPVPVTASTEVDGEPAHEDATADSAALDELVPRVKAVLGGGLERLELVSIDGEVLTRWSSSEDVQATRDTEGVGA